jgi:hypothetical protein
MRFSEGVAEVEGGGSRFRTTGAAEEKRRARSIPIGLDLARRGFYIET